MRHREKLDASSPPFHPGGSLCFNYSWIVITIVLDRDETSNTKTLTRLCRPLCCPTGAPAGSLTVLCCPTGFPASRCCAAPQVPQVAASRCCPTDAQAGSVTVLPHRAPSYYFCHHINHLLVTPSKHQPSIGSRFFSHYLNITSLTAWPALTRGP